MRMRRKRHLFDRLQNCEEYLLAKDYLTADTRRAIEERSSLLNLEEVFGNTNPVYLELGCGLGGFCIELAKRHPEINILAVERVTNVLLTALERAKEENLNNLRFLNIPVECLPAFLADCSVERIYLNFSTPLPKAGQVKQRLTHPSFLSLYYNLLKPGGEIHQKTDSPRFFEFSLESFSSVGFTLKDISLDLHHSDYTANIVTEYEKNFSDKGFPIYRLVAEKENDFAKELSLAQAAVPTKLFFGEHCVKKNAEVFSSLGKHALIVTGKSSLKNGSLHDIQEALTSQNIAYTVFNEVTPNPTLSCIHAAVKLLQEVKADFVIGIGGGSPMDAAKAVATFALQDRADEEVFKGGYEEKALPIVCVPTTAGTGSEVTPYAILTNDFEQTKTSISSKAMFPKFAFLDAEYLSNLNRGTTIHTAVDALSHAVEGMFTLSSTPQTDEMALKAISLIFSRWRRMKDHALVKQDRETLLVASTLAGAVIAHTGTTIVHSMGYSLTYFHGVDHGRANGLLLGKMLELCETRQPEKTKRILAAAELSSAKEFSEKLVYLLGKKEHYKKEELLSFAKEASKSKKLSKITYAPTAEDIEWMFLSSFEE